MNVFITIDVECDHNHGYDDMVSCRCQDGRRWGIEFIAETLSDYGLKGVFFVEPLGTKTYGETGLKEAIDLVLSFGHEVQLHLHPSFDGGTDALHQYRLDQQIFLIRKGREILRRFVTEKISAFRAGSFSANTDTLKALERCQIDFDSSYNLNYINSNCKIAAPFPLNSPVPIGSVWEIPVTCFDWPFHRFQSRYRHVQLTATGFQETLDVLNMGQLLHYDCVTILLHSFEFVKRNKGMTPIYKNINRFKSLCQFLQQNTLDMPTKGFHDISSADLDRWRSAIPSAIPSVRLSSWGRRNVAQLAERMRG